ncbi:MAG: hypothetical protein SPM09_13185 [Fibrobacter sp.]|uniref:hypothetical protein n=1 Tax=Fibrobacter sp. TaxID=35828 RepID=UPI002A9208E6|nr:hypothetical protein [Fibrobacter sp.]MDY6265352.1 hypothetical protein [Fibrobacter sp.]
MGFLDFNKIKQNAFDAVKTAQNKISEVKNSETVNQLLKKADEAKAQVLSTAESLKESALQELQEKRAVADKYAKVLQENETIKGILQKGNSIVEVVGNHFDKIANDEDVVAVWNKTSEISSAVGKSSLKGLKVISGVSAVMNRKEAIATREEADKLKAEIESTNENIRDDLNETLEEFGKVRLVSLHNTVGVFLSYLDQLNQKVKSKEYDFLKEIDISVDEIHEMKEIDMKASDAVKVAAVGGGFAAIALAGTPTLVTSAVTAFATASTGTAISTLHGVAATNAVLAWLGGGSIAAGGGGMAAGAATLATITAAATASVAIIAVGTLASAFYARKNTEATKYLAEIQEWAEQIKASWLVLGGIKARVLELQGLTQQLECKAMESLRKLGKIVDEFDANNIEHTKIFQQAAIMVKSMSELAQVAVLDNDGNLNDQVNIVAAKTEKMLNSEV